MSKSPKTKNADIHTDKVVTLHGMNGKIGLFILELHNANIVTQNRSMWSGWYRFNDRAEMSGLIKVTPIYWLQG